jgi:ABC-type Fe3+ transport system permease subunit
VLLGVVQGISPSLEEASQTLRARGWTTFRTVTLPLLRPGLAAAFLIGFVESMADFGNPLVLAGNFEVLSTKIFFAVVGASHDQSRAAVLALVLLVFTLAAFWAQQRWLGRASYTTVTGKGDAGLPVPLPRGLRRLCYGITLPWAALTFVIYATIFVGGFVRAVGRDYSFTLDHFFAGFSIEMTQRGLHFTGAAWPSLSSTLIIATVAAPLTAALGLLTAWLLSRQDLRASAPSSSARCSASPSRAPWSASATSSRSTCRRSSSPAPPRSSSSASCSATCRSACAPESPRFPRSTSRSMKPHTPLARALRPRYAAWYCHCCARRSSRRWYTASCAR